MTFDEYQQQALTTMVRHKDPLMNKTVLAMGVAGEAGEVIEKWKKLVGYWDGDITDEFRQEMGKELADVVWYIATLSHELGLSFDEIMQQNVEKLRSRQERGAIKGAGDNR
ncbi:MAG TPA: nucleoside triphosphate pyrophosphohydrolase family protein [Candidatus Saccharimonadales bacterium]|nr:nucleoside triphosphate pyrophosphohydrolase family protein [Candidatus Saccharimonadales bacterium]